MNMMNQKRNEECDGAEDKDTSLMRMRFEEILNTLTTTTKEKMGKRERLMKLKKGVPKAEIDIE